MSVKNWFPRGLSSTEQSPGISNLATGQGSSFFSYDHLQHCLPWVQDVIGQFQAFSIAKLSQDSPGRLHPPLLNKDSMQVQEPKLSGRKAWHDGLNAFGIISSDEFQNTFEFLKLKRRSKAFLLRDFDFEI
jgi:hypothetical protein